MYTQLSTVNEVIVIIVAFAATSAINPRNMQNGSPNLYGNLNPTKSYRLSKFTLIIIYNFSTYISSKFPEADHRLAIKDQIKQD